MLTIIAGLGTLLSSLSRFAVNSALDISLVISNLILLSSVILLTWIASDPFRDALDRTTGH